MSVTVTRRNTIIQNNFGLTVTPAIVSSGVLLRSSHVGAIAVVHAADE
jgi:hypothetical protein